MSHPWIVLKFGGTSVATPDSWSLIASRARELKANRRVWIVASAMADVTDRLEEAVEQALRKDKPRALSRVHELHDRLASEIGLTPEDTRTTKSLMDDLEGWLEGIRLTGEAAPRLRAKILSTGELVTTRLGAAALERHGVETRWVDARKLLQSRPRPGELESRRFLEARVPPVEEPAQGERAAAGSRVVLTQGFIASTDQDETCLLGRGGSDTSAALFAVMLDAEKLEIWTDVPGLFTADPRMIPSARLIRRIGNREAQELAAMGAKVLHPRCLPPLAEAGIPVCIRSTRDTEIDGTRIEGVQEEHAAVTAVTCRTGTTLVTLSTWAMWETPGFLARAFAPFAELGISVDLVGTSQSAVSMTLDGVPGGVEGRSFKELIGRLNGLGQVEVEHPCAVVSIVGRRIRSALHELGPALAAFRELPVHLISDSSEDLNLSFVVDEQDAQPLVARLHGLLFSAQGGDPRLGPTWEKLRGVKQDRPSTETWWCHHREALLGKVTDGKARYVYHLPEVTRRARDLLASLPSIGRFYYAMKANPHPAILEAVASEGLGLECGLAFIA